MNPIGWFLDNPVKVSVGVILLSLFGTLALVNMPMQLSPDVTQPVITIQTNWPGASPQEIEKEIINEQEEKLKSVEGVIRVSAECGKGFGELMLEFRVGTNMNEALLKVNSLLQQVREYPIDADKPVVRTSSQSDRSIAWLILGSRPPDDSELQKFADEHPLLKPKLDRAIKTSNIGLKKYRLREIAAEHPEAAGLLPPDIDISLYKKFAEDVLEAQLERVPGVADAYVRGGQLPQVHIVVDAARLAARGLTLTDVRNALLQNNTDISAGDFIDGKKQVIVRTLGRYTSLEQLANQIIRSEEGTSVYIRDVADVQMGYEKNEGMTRRYGEPSISLSIMRDPSANVVDVMKGIQAEVVRLNDGILAQNGLILAQVYDETTYIRSAVGLVQQNIVIGGALTMVVLLLFLHLGARALIASPIIMVSAFATLYVHPLFMVVTLALLLGIGFWYARGTLIVGIAIPVSIIGTFLFLSVMGRTLNVISLAGMAFAVGMLVDNSIVVLENIFRFMDKGLGSKQASGQAVREVWGAVLASTMTTLAVFLPVIFLEGEVGQLFGDIALAISFAVGTSLVVSVLVLPVAASRLLREAESQRARRPSRLAAIFARSGRSTSDLVTSVNRLVNRSFITNAGFCLGVIAGVSLLGWLIFPKVDYLPAGNRNLVFCSVLTPPGYSIERLTEVGTEIENILKPYWDIDPGFESTDHLGFPSIADYFCGIREGSIFLGLRAHEDLEARKLIDLIQSKLKGEFPGTNVVASQTSIFGRGMSGGRNIEVEISGPELEQLLALGTEIDGRIRQNYPPNTQIRAIPSLDLTATELNLELKPEVAGSTGITSDDLGYIVNTLVDGAYATDYFIGGERIDVVLKNQVEPNQMTGGILSQYIATSNATVPVRLDSIATMKMTSGPEVINHRERQRSITLDLSPPAEMSLETAIAKINDTVLAPMEAEGKIGKEYRVYLSGTADKLQQTWNALKWNFLLAVLITYLLLAGLFESWIYPLVIITSVPLGAVGGIAGLQLLSRFQVAIGEPPQSLDVLTMLGFVILVGTVVNNAILIVHQSIVIRSEGKSGVDAVEESVKTRIRPIFMTTITTVFGLAPLVIFPGAGSELYRGLGSVVLGGLLLSTLLTLFMIPGLLLLVIRIEDYFRGNPKKDLERPAKENAKPAFQNGAPREQEKQLAGTLVN